MFSRSALVITIESTAILVNKLEMHLVAHQDNVLYLFVLIRKNTHKYPADSRTRMYHGWFESAFPWALVLCDNKTCVQPIIYVLACGTVVQAIALSSLNHARFFFVDFFFAPRIWGAIRLNSNILKFAKNAVDFSQWQRIYKVGGAGLAIVQDTP